jgi:hypothetical protein
LDPLFVQQVESKLYQKLALIPAYPAIPSQLDLTSQVEVTSYKESVKSWLKTEYPHLYKQPIIPELAMADWAELFGMEQLSQYRSLSELLYLAPHQVPFIRLSLNYPCNWELELLKYHNAKFMAQLWKYCQGGKDTLLTPDEWELLVLEHDLGKPRAIERSYLQSLDKKQQKADNEEIRRVFWSYVHPQVVTIKTHQLIDLVLDHDLLVYEYLSQPLSSSEELLLVLTKLAESTGYELKKLLKTFYVYYLCDGSTYTLTAGGRPSFDFQFFSKAGQLELWPSFARKWQELLALVP